MGRIAALWRHPVKGFTPERLDHADLEAGRCFPCDRLYAVERGPSGFDPAAPVFLSKQRFTVLANHPRLARAVTAYRDADARLQVRLADQLALDVRLDRVDGREAFAAWLARFLGEDEDRRLRVLHAGRVHRFTDDEAGFVSLINLESLRAFGERIGREVAPARLRANLHLEGWPAWSERALLPGARLRLGGVELEVIKPIPRCIATHVEPATGERDLDLLPLLRAHYGHVDCGLYLRIVAGGRLQEGDRVHVV